MGPHKQLEATSLHIFQEQIGNHAAGHLSSTIRENSPTSEIAKNIGAQIRKEAIEKATEMFGPLLAVLHAKNLPFSSFKTCLKGIFFSQIFSFWERYIEDRCMALIKHSRQISYAMNTNEFHFEILDGDPHNGLQKPVKISIPREEKKIERFVLKPVNAFPYKLTHEAGEILASHLNIESLSEKITNESQDIYIRSFIYHHPGKNIKNPSSYFYSFGAMCSLASLLEITDLHFENIIATDNGPKFIDIEMMLNKVSQGGVKWGYVESGLFQSYTSPIAQIKKHNHIIPSLKVCNGRLVFDTTELKFANFHLIRKNSYSLANPIEHTSDIQKGALDADNVLRCNLIKICDFIYSQNHGRIRALIRNTAYYRILQIQLWLPSDNLHKNIESIRNKLSQKKGVNGKFDEETRNRIVDLELKDLCKGDIPYFWIDCISGDLMHSSGIVKKKYVPSIQSLFEKNFRNWAQRKSKRDMVPIMKRLFRMQE